MVIQARFDGTCRKCGGTIRAGTQINWERGGPTTHVTCPPRTTSNTTAAPAVRRNAKAGYCDSCHIAIPAGAGHLWKCCPDGGCMEHFDTDDGGWHVSCLDSAACKARVAEQKAKRAAAQAEKRRIDAEFAAIEAALRAGERPGSSDSPVVVEGDRYCDSASVYGGGSWFVVASQHIWYVQNNGADGDDWSRNNVRTGGAGAIGWRIPFDGALAERIKTLDQARKWR